MLHRRAVLLLFALIAPLRAVAAPADPLWSRAVEASARAARWSPGEMRLAIEMADDAGKVLETWDNRYRLSVDENGTLRTEVVSAFHNGKDETEKEREAQAKRERTAGPDGTAAWSRYLDDPFDPDVQEAVEATRLAGTRDIAGASCVAFAFTLAKPKNVRIEGTVWLDGATGQPVELASRPAPLPRAVTELSTFVRYDGGLVSEVRIEGSGNFLFIKRRLVSVITLAGWFRIGS